MWLHFEEKWRLQPLGGPRDCTICQEPLYNFNVMSWDFGKHMYILRSYQGNWAQELIRYTRSLRWRKVMVIKHYSGMASHWPVIWYQVCASRTGHQKTSKLSQELQSSIELASFTTYLPFCSPMWTWTNHFLFPTHFLHWDPGSVFHLAAISEVSFSNVTLAALVAVPSRHWSGLFSYHYSFSAHLRNLLNLLYSFMHFYSVTHMDVRDIFLCALLARES